MRRRLKSFESEHNRSKFAIAAAFLEGRLEATSTVEWALSARGDSVARDAISALIARTDQSSLSEPWRTVWSLIEEEAAESGASRFDGDVSLVHIEQARRKGEFNGTVIADIAQLVRPRLSLSPNKRNPGTGRAKAPKAISDVIQASITSERTFNPSRLLLHSVADPVPLVSLIRALEVGIDYGLDLGRRLRWNINRDTWRFGLLRRIYYVDDASDEEPDRFDTGLTPSLKVIHAATTRLANLEPKIASGIVRGWGLRDNPIYTRLWAALSFSKEVTPIGDVLDSIRSMSVDDFWDLHALPELTELRARRFPELSEKDQRFVLQRIRRGPPKKRWGSTDDQAQVERARRYWRARELRRLEIGGATLPKRDQDWLSEAIIDFPELREMSLQHDFLDGVRAAWREADPDDSFNGLTGEALLGPLEAALKIRATFSSDPAQRAADWIRADHNTLAVLSGLKASKEPSRYPKIWERFLWAHNASKRELIGPERADDAEAEAVAVIELLMALPESLLKSSIDGVTHWMGEWHSFLHPSTEIADLWFKAWPIAVASTNRQSDSPLDLNAVVFGVDDDEPDDLDTLNTAAGRLVGVFLGCCPSLSGTSNPFAKDPTLKRMRDTASQAEGRSGLIARFRMIESLSYFYRADKSWTIEHLIGRLIGDDPQGTILWRALGRSRLSNPLMKKLAPAMTTRARDVSLGRQTRKNLLFALVINALHSFIREQKPAASGPSLQQTIRVVEPEIRSHAAFAISKFIKECSVGDKRVGSPEQLFSKAVSPFMMDIWPQEHSLASSGTSRELADIPAASGGEFSNAVSLLRRFLVPFDCWSLNDYGFRPHGETNRLQELINDSDTAGALLDLLDHTIGSADDAVVPYDLSKALGHIERIAPVLTASPKYKRLAAATRR